MNAKIDLGGALCPSCEKNGLLFVEVSPSANDNQLIDIIVTCHACRKRWNASFPMSRFLDHFVEMDQR
jgi:DNA-directed RNA polymerase subunit M/transcription elongation factor TFIIS